VDHLWKFPLKVVIVIIVDIIFIVKFFLPRVFRRGNPAVPPGGKAAAG
jgi:hypothetical protein